MTSRNKTAFPKHIYVLKFFMHIRDLNEKYFQEEFV